MKMAAARAIAQSLASPDVDRILPSALDMTVPAQVCQAVKAAALVSGESGR